MEHRGHRPGVVSPSQIPRPTPRPRPPNLPINVDVHEGPAAVTVSRTPSHISSLPSSSSIQGPTFFRDATTAIISGGQLNNHQGDQVRTNVTINFTSPNPLAGNQRLWAPDSPSQGARDPEGAGSERTVTTGSSQMRVHRNTEDQPETANIQRSNKIYESQLLLKGRGYPLWIPQPSLSLPIPYRTNGICVGDVGIITAYGGFDFLFNVCLPRDHPIHPRVLPDGFVPIDPPLDPTDIRKFREFASGSFLATSSVAKAYNESPASGLIFESSGEEGAILTMPDGAYHEELGNVSGFRDYTATHAKNWYKYVNGPRGREAKNGDVHLVVGCDKATKWGMATFSNHSHATFQLKFRTPDEQQRLGSGCTHFWEHSAMAEVRVGPDEDENDELGATRQQPLRNQCLFVRTLNVMLADDVWATLDAESLVTRQQKSPDSDSNTGPGRTPRPHAPGRESPNSTPFNNTSKSEYRYQLLNANELPAVGEEDSHSGYTGKSVIITEFNQAPHTVHPSKLLNEFLLSQNPGATMAVTHDKDWYSLLTNEDTDFPDPRTLVHRIQLLNDVCEDNGIVYLQPKGRDETSLTSERGQIAKLGLGLLASHTTLFEYVFGHDQEVNRWQILQDTIEDLTNRISSAPYPPVHQLSSSLPGHPFRHLILDDLLKLLKGELRYEDTREESIPFLWSQLSVSIKNQPKLFPDHNRIQCLLRLGNALQQRYSRLSLLDDLEDAIHCYSQAASLSLPPRFHYRHLEANMGLAFSIYQQYLARGRLEDLIILKDTLEQQQEFDVKSMLQPFADQPTMIKFTGADGAQETGLRRRPYLRRPPINPRAIMKYPSKPDITSDPPVVADLQKLTSDEVAVVPEGKSEGERQQACVSNSTTGANALDENSLPPCDGGGSAQKLASIARALLPYKSNHCDPDDSTSPDTTDLVAAAPAATILNQGQSSVIQMLPPEVASEIFAHCIPPFKPYRRDTYDRFAPLVLGSICSYWRNIAWATPQLWASPTFRLMEEGRVMEDLSFIKEWIQRSGSLPMSIRWQTTWLEDEWEIPTRDTLMQVILDGCSRWKDVDLRLSTDCYQYLPTSANSFPLLQTMTIKKPPGDFNAAFANFSESTSVLTEMSITRLYLRSIRARWDMLTKLEVRQLYTDECLELFRQTPNIVNLIVRRVINGNGGHEIPDSAIVLPRLQTLDMFTDLDTDMLLFFANMATPELTHFRFLLSGHLPFPVDGIISYFKRSGCRLEVAVLSDVDEDEVFRLWSMFPTLTVVSLGHEAVTRIKMRPVLNRDILSAFNTPESTRYFPVYYLLPALKQLKCPS